jgi:hypothetical protein
MNAKFFNIEKNIFKKIVQAKDPGRFVFEKQIETNRPHPPLSHAKIIA